MIKCIYTTFLCLIFFFAFPLDMRAQNVSDFFMEAPDSLFPHVPKDQRKELIALRLIDPTTMANTSNVFGREVCLLFMSDEVIQIALGNYQLGILRLPRLDASMANNTNQNDSLFCCLETCRTPEPETIAKIYNKDYSLVNVIDFSTVELPERPDTMSEETFADCLHKIELPMREAVLESRSSPLSLVVTLRYPFSSSKEEDDKMKSLIMQKKVKWDGKIFKEVK